MSTEPTNLDYILRKMHEQIKLTSRNLASTSIYGSYGIIVLSNIPDGLFAGDAGRAKFEDGFVTETKIADNGVTEPKIAPNAVSTAKIKDAAITTAKIGDLQVTGAKIADATIGNAKITDLDAGKITSGYLSVDRIQAGSIVSSKLYSGSIMANRISAEHLRTDIALITQQAQLADLVVTTTKLAETLGIKSAEIPVLDPDEYYLGCTAIKGQGTKWCPTSGYSVVGKTFQFNAYSYIKHELKKVAVKVENLWNDYVVSGTTYLRCMYSTDGSNWNQFGSELSWTSPVSNYTEYTFTGNVLTDLNAPFYVRLEAKIYNAGSVDGNAVITLYVKDFELRERAFRSQRSDI